MLYENVEQLSTSNEKKTNNKDKKEWHMDEQTKYTLDCIFSLDCLLTDSSTSTQSGAFEFNKNKEIEKEVNLLSTYLSIETNLEGIPESAVFWLSNRIKMPNLSKLFSLLDGINSSSAIVERLFSICGVIANKRNQNMTHDLFQIRSMLASNIELLDDLSDDTFLDKTE
jgi:hypothetical protein